jgi:hypothetical protein
MKLCGSSALHSGGRIVLFALVYLGVRGAFVGQPQTPAPKSLLGKQLLMRFGEASHHDPNQSYLDDGSATLGRVLVVAVEPTPTGQPTERPLYYPTTVLNFETLAPLPTPHDGHQQVQ